VGLLKKKKKKAAVVHFSGGGASGSQISHLRPQAVDKLPPCVGECPSGNDVRGWLTAIAQREKQGLSLEQACDKAWMIEVETNPFPAVMGRVCPHPCEGACNRKEKDESVAINSVERYIGDWGIERSLKLPALDAGGPFDEKIAVIGAGPSGLTCAYQLARRGYKVTVFDALEKPGGMLRYGIPGYRLPRNTAVGANGVTLADLREQYDAVFVGIGAHKGKTMGIPGEDGSGVYTGTDFLNRANAGRDVEVGEKVVIIGGGDTAIDAARVSLRIGSDAAAISRRMGSEVTILYRRTRAEMPAIELEIEQALEEGIKIEFLAAPVKVLRDGDGKLAKLAVQRMELGEPDDSGRRRPVPIEGDVYEMEADTLVEAVSQAPDWDTLGGGIEVKGNWLEVDEWGRTAMDGVWSGGDTLTLGLATISIGQGRKAAECIHATLRGEEPKAPFERPPIAAKGLQLDWYDSKPKAQRTVLTAEARLRKPADEMDLGISAEAALEETTRCFSCGLCFGCENCWMYCQNNCFKKTKELAPGHYYDLDLSTCDGCKKCAEECPCGFLELY